jgi:phosphate transport system permease protein
MLPFLYVQIKETLRSIPASIREAAYSLGLSRIRANIFVFLVYARGSILTAILIAISKIMGETAPLLFTAFGSDFYTVSDPQFLFKPIGSLTLAIYNLGLSPYEEWIETAWGASFILLIMVLTLYIIARYMIRGAYGR